MRIAICEDEAVIAKQIADITYAFFEESGSDCNIDLFFNGADFEKKQDLYDLLFLDYKLSDINGIELAHKIRKTNQKLVIIFVTAYSEHVFESFEVGAYRYILKPIEEDEIRKSLFSLLSANQHSRPLCVPMKHRKIYVDLDDIMYIESNAKYSVVRTQETAYDSSRSLLFYEQEIHSQHFIKTHKRFLVNMNYIAEIEKNIITLTNGEKIEISRRSLNAFNTAYTKFLKYTV